MKAKHAVFKFLERFIKDEAGTTAVEYAIIGSGIAAVIAVSVYAVGTPVNNMYVNINNSIP